MLAYDDEGGLAEPPPQTPSVPEAEDLMRDWDQVHLLLAYIYACQIACSDAVRYVYRTLKHDSNV